MGFFNRFLLFIYTLCVAFLSLGVIAIVLHVIPERNIWNEYQYLAANWQTGAGALLFFLLSVHLLFCSLASSKSKSVSNSGEVIVVKGDSGNVEVSLGAIQDMVHRISSNVNGVREVKIACGIHQDKELGDKLKVDVRLSVGQERSVSAISDDVRGKLSDSIRNVLCIEDSEIAVYIDSVVSGVVTKKRRLM